jgi:D-alanyl-D-alanine carboxypeptidase (penicillin-binding protein 5/6)
MKKMILALLMGLVGWHANAAESYIIIDNQTGVILDSDKRNEKLQVASLTKVATSLVVLDWAELKKIDLSTFAEVPATATDNGASSSIGLAPGDTLSLRDLIYCALLASDNIAANTLAHHVGSRISNPEQLDPTSNFVAQMNALSRSLLMKRTLFLNPSGLDSMKRGAIPYSTAEDLARLTRYAYDKSGFAFYVSQKSRQIHILRGGIDMPYEIKNTNELVGRNGIDGVKTGRTRKAGDCLILSADRPPESRREGETVLITPRRITVVLLGSEDRFKEGTALIQGGWRLYDAWAAEGRLSKKGEVL